MNDRYCVFNYGDCKRLDDAYAAGLAEGIRRCREAVEKNYMEIIDANLYTGCDCHERFLAAIDAVRGE